MEASFRRTRHMPTATPSRESWRHVKQGKRSDIAKRCSMTRIFVLPIVPTQHIIGLFVEYVFLDRTNGISHI